MKQAEGSGTRLKNLRHHHSLCQTLPSGISLAFWVNEKTSIRYYVSLICVLQNNKTLNSLFVLMYNTIQSCKDFNNTSQRFCNVTSYITRIVCNMYSIGLYSYSEKFFMNFY